MSLVYAYPHYYALAYRWNTEEECDVIEDALRRWYPGTATRLVDLGCGAGRHALELAARGYAVTGVDPSPEMVAYAREQADWRSLAVTVQAGTLASFGAQGPFDAAVCVMDTFRFLLSDEAILGHLQCVADALVPGGLYLIDCWAPRGEPPPADRYEWEQASETTRVRVEYVQYPDSWDASSRTFDDELIFHVSEDGTHQEIRGGRTRTRWLLPEEFAALGAQAGWRVIGQFDGFNLGKPRSAQHQSWRVVTVLQASGSR